MLPTTSDNGARLAAILPTGLAAMAKGLGGAPLEQLGRALGADDAMALARDLVRDRGELESLPGIRSLVLVVVDGLGSANLNASRALAPTLAALGRKRIETVVPSTTGAALTTLATGRLPGRHGLIGYRIRHPQLGLRTTLKEWDGIADVREWQRSEPLWSLASGLGARAVAIGRPAHAGGGLTGAILSGAEYRGAQTIADRFGEAAQLLNPRSGGGGDPLLAYVYIDELDKAAHSDGWQSELWKRRLRALDQALEDFLRSLPGDVGVVVTADHGIVDIPAHRRVDIDTPQTIDPALLSDVVEYGGEPRFRSLYLREGADPARIAAGFGAALGRIAHVGTREEAIAAGWFGDVAAEVAPRLGEVLVVARAQVAFTLSSDDEAARRMIGQHGGLSAEERGIPLLLAGSIAGSGFGSAVAAVAALSEGGASG